MKGIGAASVTVLLFLVLAPLAAQDRLLTVQEMSARAEVIGTATVQSQAVRLDPQNNMIYTDYTLKFSEAWKGSPQEPFVLTKAGGQIGDRATAMVGQDYQFRNGESVVVFTHASSPGRNVVIGIRQGIYRIHEGIPRTVSRMAALPREPSSSGQTLLALKQDVYRILGRPWDGPSPETLPSSPPSTETFSGRVTNDAGAPLKEVPKPRSEASDPRLWIPAWIFLGLVLLGLFVWFSLRRRLKTRDERKVRVDG